MTPLFGALGEAWAELRTHKLRVILSLIGIGVAVAALTAVVALGELQRQVIVEQSDRYGGRVATIAIGTVSNDGSPIDWADVNERFEEVAERYRFSHTARVIEGGQQLQVQLPEGITPVETKVFDTAYPLMHRLPLLEGRWFVDEDAQLLASPVVISEALWDRLGRVPLSEHPSLRMSGDFAGLSPIIGVSPRDGVWDDQLRVSLLFDDYEDRLGVLPSETYLSQEIWVPERLAGEIGAVLAMDLRAKAPPGQEIVVTRTDWAAQPGFNDSFAITNLITGGIAGIVLLLGGLSLLNIQLVAMRQRIREIGIRRSFGASGARIFTAVMLESVVAATLAGLAGIALAVAVLRSPFVIENMFYGVQDLPPFPFAAALTGLIASVAVGALAGLIPAMVALRVRVIDAIRY